MKKLQFTEKIVWLGSLSAVVFIILSGLMTMTIYAVVSLLTDLPIDLTIYYWFFLGVFTYFLFVGYLVYLVCLEKEND